MKHIKGILLLAGTLLAADSASAQTNLAFTQQDVVKEAGQTSITQVYALSNANKITTRTYYDGLSRPIQNVAVQASPAQNDIIQPVAYDSYGRQTVQYLPYAGTSSDVSGSYRPNATSTDQAHFYSGSGGSLIPKDVAPYSQAVFENSPLQRTLSAGMIGAGHQPTGATLSGGTGTQHYKTVTHRYNNSADGNVMVWNPDGTFIANNYYSLNRLAVTIGQDEDGVETFVFTDVAGHTILKRQLNNAVVNGSFETYFDTYYVYNNAGDIAFIIPPKAMSIMYASSNYSLTQASVASLIYSYGYDPVKGWLTTEQVPNKGTVSFIYDQSNRLVLVQDANLKTSNQWNYIKYDIKNRPISQGIYTDATRNTPSAMQTYVSSQAAGYESRSSNSATGYYTNSAFPSASITALAFSFFDDYNLNEDPNGVADYALTGTFGGVTATTAQVKDVPTMLLHSTVGSNLTPTWLLTVNFYDRNGHLIQSRSNNLLNYTNALTLTDSKTVVPNFNGLPTQSQVVHVTGNGTVTNTVITTLSYDQVYRVTGVTQQYNSQSAVMIASYTYNELGELANKQLGSTNNGATWLQQVNFRYNIRGQLTNINNSTLTNDNGVTNSRTDAAFGMQMLYDSTATNLGNTPYYNGKLSAVKWMSKDGSGNNSYERAFSYSYDNLDRYMGETYAERPSGSSANFTVTHGWDEKIIGYDENGNIQKLSRNSSTQGSGTHTQIDSLTYGYNTTNANQLLTVTDASGNTAGFRNYMNSSGPYAYDAAGNLQADPYKGTSNAQFNVLNRVDKTTFSYNATGRYIYYIYNNDGTLLRKMEYDNNTLGTTTDYIDGFVYTTQSGSTTLAYFPMPEGRVTNSGGTLTPEYIISDQQGNARVSVNNTGTGGAAKVVQENSYYGFGLIMPGTAVTTLPNANKNLYNGGSEWQNDYTNQPDYYQTYNRGYDPSLGRFMAPDPVAVSAESMTTYQYAGNNPIMLNDPLGDKLPDGEFSRGGYFFSSEGAQLSPPDQLAKETYVSPLLPGSGPMDPNWQVSGAFYDPNDPSNSYNGSSGAGFWLPAEMSGGALDPRSGNISVIAFANGKPVAAQNLTASNGVLQYETIGVPTDGSLGQEITTHNVTFNPNANQGGMAQENIYHLVPNSVQWKIYDTPDGPVGYANMKAHQAIFNIRDGNGKVVDRFVANIPKLSFEIPEGFKNNIDLEIKFSDAWDSAMSDIDDYFQLGDERLRNPVYFMQQFESFLGQELIGTFMVPHGIQMDFYYIENVPLSTPKYTPQENH